MALPNVIASIAAAGSLLVAGAAPAQALGDAAGKAGCVNVGGATAESAAVGSPGLLSGNLVQVPINIPLNLCGNTIALPGPGGSGGGG
ncbi:MULTISPECIES: chaplin [unclassified Kitasatospora]|uniref:chaplin n=1 Tax=unclassified Kitasatospora TaxID=2633591 RepID=UPI0034051091